MAKFYMTRCTGMNNSPISINLDRVVAIQPVADECSSVLMDNGTWLCVDERYENLIKNIAPFVPFDEMVDSNTDSEWLRNYIDGLPKGASLC